MELNSLSGKMAIKEKDLIYCVHIQAILKLTKTICNNAININLQWSRAHFHFSPTSSPLTALDFPEKAKTTKTALNINRDAQYIDTILVIGQYSVNTGYILATHLKLDYLYSHLNLRTAFLHPFTQECACILSYLSVNCSVAAAVFIST